MKRNLLNSLILSALATPGLAMAANAPTLGEVLDASEIKLLVEGLDLPPIKPLPAKTDDGVQQVIKPERSPAKGGERPATA